MVLEIEERIADLENRLKKSQRLEKCHRCDDRFLASSAESHGKVHALQDELGLTNERFPTLVGGVDLAVEKHSHLDKFFGRTEELTIASDVMPQPRRKHVILNAESGTTDDLDGITVRNVVEGFAFLLSPKSTDTISIKHKNAGASSGERISSTSGGSFSIAPGESALIWYDSVSDSTNPWHAIPFSTVSAHAKYTDADALSAAPAVTVSGTPDYITLSGQDIIRGLIDLTADVTGLLPIANIHGDIARDSELHNASHTLDSHSAKAHADLSDAPASAHHARYTDAEALSAAPAEPDADLTTKGVIELATIDETDTGTDATRAVTPAGHKDSTHSLVASETHGSPSANTHHATSRPYTYSITFGWDPQSPQVFAP